MSLLDLHNTSHDMYLPNERAKRIERPLYLASSEVIGDPHGTQAEREAWMRERQHGKQERQQTRDERAQTRAALKVQRTEQAIRQENERMAIVEGQREAQLLMEAESEIRRRHAAEGVK